MNEQRAIARASRTSGIRDLLKQYGCGPIQFTGTGDALYERHLMFDNVVDPAAVGPRERYEAVARSVRDILSQRWLRTEQTYEHENPKRVYYLSMEFLIGRSLANNILNLLLDPAAKQLRRRERPRLARPARAGARCRPRQWRARPPRGVLPRLDGHDAAPGHGLRAPLRVRHLQADHPGRLAARGARQLAAASRSVGGRPAAGEGRGQARLLVRGARRHPGRDPRPAVEPASGFPSIAPSWATAARPSTRSGSGPPQRPTIFDFQAFSAGDFVSALAERLAAESLTRVLYPDDSTSMGQGLRFVQEYFLVACSLADLVRRFRRSNADWSALPDKVAIQLNDTHPSLAVAELMRILLDEAHLGWDQAWDLTRQTLAYTNHTLLPEALEKWPLRVVRAAAAAPSGDHPRDQPPPPRGGAGPLPGRRGPCRARQPHRGGRRAQDPDGQPGHRRLAQHERRRRHPFRPAAHE